MNGGIVVPGQPERVVTRADAQFEDAAMRIRAFIHQRTTIGLAVLLHNGTVKLVGKAPTPQALHDLVVMAAAAAAGQIDPAGRSSFLTSIANHLVTLAEQMDGAYMPPAEDGTTPAALGEDA